MPRKFSFIFLFLFLPQLYAENNFQKICIRNVCIEAEIADSPAARARGLMFRQGLGENQGMFFIFEDEDWHVFWMKNMRFSLDMIWINSEKTIVDIKEGVPPCRETCENITSTAKVKYVLEVNPGFIKNYGVKIGDAVRF